VNYVAKELYNIVRLYHFKHSMAVWYIMPPLHQKARTRLLRGLYGTYNWCIYIS